MGPIFSCGNFEQPVLAKEPDAMFNYNIGSAPNTMPHGTRIHTRRREPQSKTTTNNLWPYDWGHAHKPPEKNKWQQCIMQPNGINVQTKLDSKILVALLKLSSLGVNQINIPESNLFFRDQKVQDAYELRLKPYWIDSRITFASSKVRTRDGNCQPGGGGEHNAREVDKQMPE